MAPPAANSNELVAGTEAGNARVISPGQHDPDAPRDSYEGNLFVLLFN